MQISGINLYRSGMEKGGCSPRISARTFCHPDSLNKAYRTKSEPSMSEEEYREAIVAQAKKDAAVGRAGWECPGFKELIDDFVCVVSPDRQSIIENGIVESQKLVPKSYSLLDILFGDGIKFELTDGKVTYGEFFDGDGQKVAEYSDTNGWTIFTTNEESQRGKLFVSIYLDAWNAETQLLQGQAGAGRPVHSGGGLDVTI